MKTWYSFFIALGSEASYMKREKRLRYTFKSGATYDGEWKGTVRDGYGIQVWPDGARYEGSLNR